MSKVKKSSASTPNSSRQVDNIKSSLPDHSGSISYKVKKTIGSFIESICTLKNVYAVAAIAMLLALRVVLGMFANTTLPFFGNNVKLSGAFLPIAVAGVMLGPVPAALVGGLGDVISFFLVPAGAGGYFPGFTISGIITGLIYGFAFYKNNISLPRTVVAWTVNMLAVETFLAAYWLYLIKGAGSVEIYYTLLVTRFISVAVKCIPEILLIASVGKMSTKIRIPNTIKSKGI